jgi:hypothetical protein
LYCDSRHDPGKSQSQAGDQRRPAYSIEQTQLGAELASKRESETFETGSKGTAEQKRAKQGKQRRVWGMIALIQQKRGQTRARYRPSGKARKRQRANYQALSVTPQAH